MTEPDLSAFRELNGVPSAVGRCGAGKFIDGLSSEEREQINAALAEGSIQASAIHKWMEKRGYRQQSDTVRKHRREECGCARP